MDSFEIGCLCILIIEVVSTRTHNFLYKRLAGLPSCLNSHGLVLVSSRSKYATVQCEGLALKSHTICTCIEYVSAALSYKH